MLALRFGFAQRLANIAGISNRLAADFENDVAGLEALVGGRAIRFNGGDDDNQFTFSMDAIYAF